MRLKLYRAASVAEAMAQVRGDLGAEALILSTRRVSDGVELTAALEPEEEAPARVCPEPARDLGFHGLPPDLAARLAGGDLSASLHSLMRFSALPINPNGPPLLLAGGPGAGKTLSVARLATRLVLAGLQPLVITADGRRAGAAEELAAYTRLLGLNLVVAATPATLSRALGRREAGMPVLIDTAGIDPFAADDIAALRNLAETAQAAPVLVMPAGLDVGEASDQARAFASFGARHLLPTRLDLVRRLGGVLSAAIAGNLVLTEAGTGPGATDGLTRITPEFLAERLIGPLPGARAEPQDFAVRLAQLVPPAPPRVPIFPKAGHRIAQHARTHGYQDDGYSD